MTQQRTFDYGAPRRTRLLNSRFLNVIPPRKIYVGYTVMAQSPATLNLNITSGTLISQDGVVIEETGTLLGVINIAPDLTYPRIDMVVANHTYGVTNPPQVYEVVQGTAGSPPSPPALPDHCVPLAQVYVPAAATEIIDQYIDPYTSYFNNLDTHNLMRSQFKELRPESTVEHGGISDKIWINAGVFVKSDGSGIVNFVEQSSPSFDPIVDPSNERRDIVTIDDLGVVGILQGAEALAGGAIAPPYPTSKQVVAEVLVSEIGTVLVHEEDIRDVRFFFNLGGGAGGGGISGETYRHDTEASTGQIIFPLPFNYNPGVNDILVYSSGMIQRVGDDYNETNSSTVTFVTPRAAGEYITVVKIGLSINSFVAPVSMYESQVATAGQTVFTFSSGTYRPGTHDLLAFRNGKRLEVVTEYTENTPTTITLANSADVNDRMVFQTIGATQLVDKGLSAILSKLVLGTDQSVPDSRVRIDSGAVVGSDDDTGTIAVTSSLIVDMLGPVGPGGLDSGTPTANSWYAIWLVKNLSTSTVNGMFSLSFVNPVMPTGYTLKRRVGAVYYMTDGMVTRFRRFKQCMQHVSIQDKYKNVLASGSVSMRTWRTVSLANFVAPTFKEVDLVGSLRADDAEFRVHHNNTDSLPSSEVGSMMEDQTGTILVTEVTDGGVVFGNTSHLAGFALPSTNLYWYWNRYGGSGSVSQINIGVTGYTDLL